MKRSILAIAAIAVLAIVCTVFFAPDHASAALGSGYGLAMLAAPAAARPKLLDASGRPVTTPLPGLGAPLSPRAVPRAIQSFRPRADGNDPAKVLADLQKAWEEFKASNDETIKARADVVATEKVERINAEVGKLQATIDEMNTRLAALQVNGSGAGGQTPEQAEYARAFNAFFRKGVGAETLKDLAVKAQLTRQSDPDGGYVVSPEVERELDRVLGTVSTMRQLATVRTTGAATYKKRVSLGGASSGWVGENEARDETDTPRIAELEFPAQTIYAEPEATEEMLDDADFDVAAWLGDEVSIEFAEQEGSAFIIGNGQKKPRGILGYDTVADASWSWGKLGFIASGAAADVTDPDALISVTAGLKQGFRSNAAWLMNRTLVGKVRKFKATSSGEYIWQPSFQLGTPATLLGYPQYDDDNMPDVGAGAFPIAFGDFRRGYLILDRRGVRVLRNPYKSPGFVRFYTTKRVGGGVQHFEAIKLIKCST